MGTETRLGMSGKQILKGEMEPEKVRITMTCHPALIRMAAREAGDVGEDWRRS